MVERWKHAAIWTLTALGILAGAGAPPANGQAAYAAGPRTARTSQTAKPQTVLRKPKLVVLLVVDQMRGDYVDKFRGQWSGGLKRLAEEGAWFREAAYPYAATETCVGHATISTGALPATHGMVSNEWWDRKEQKKVTCTSDPQVKNVGYGAASVQGGDSVWRMLIPAFADELKYQAGTRTRVVTFSLKARAAITLGGHAGDAVTWFDPAAGAWTTSSAYPVSQIVAEYTSAHPVSNDYGKTWTPLLDKSAYLYDATAVGAVAPPGFGAAFPHPLRGKAGSQGADAAFYLQWETSPYAETYLAEMAAAAVEKLALGRGSGTDFLGVSFSSLDYVAHAFGPRSWEVQDELARLDRDLAAFFARLDRSVGRGNYVVALSADHGGAPIPEDLQKTGVDAGWLSVQEVKQGIEKALESFNYPKPAVAEAGGGDVYFAAGVYEKLKRDPAAMRVVAEAVQSVPGVARIFWADELDDRPATQSPVRRAEAASFYAARSGDLLIAPKPFWLWDFAAGGRPRGYATTHGTPHYYDQRVPIFLMGYGIQPGQYHGDVTPADIAPTLAALCGITLASRDGRVLAEALREPAASRVAAPAAFHSRP